ncbi:hypothetical protein BJ944DRAFT_270773 [Cunninghamella echinulata]|nr:hypothetical protein BJ944DRAFT_270773 [Cunninghamella echinulata]
MNGLRPLYKWFRFIIYLFIFYLLYKTFENLLTTPDPPTPLSYNNNNNNNNKYNNLVSPEKLDKSASPPPSFKKKEKDERTSFMPLYRDFPWYKQPHNRFLFKGEASTIDLTLQQRQQLQYDLIDKAKQQTQKSLASIGYVPLGIPGTNVQTEQQVKVLREKIACWTQGSWQPVKKSKQQLLNHVQDPLYAMCDKNFYKKNKDPQMVRPETQYQWVPSLSSSMCPLQYHATPDQWCSLLNGRHILLVGDLLQYQLHEIFLDTLRDGPTVCFGELNCKDHTLCSKPDTRLRYLRNDILLNNPKHVQNNGHPAGSIITWPFVASNILKAYPILILNRSPIIESDEDFITSLIRTMAHIRKTTPETLIIYRSSPIGHPYCNDANAPLTQPLTEEEWKRLPYGWSELERRNQIAKSIVEEAGGIFIDLAALVNVRPDGHVGNQDCIRYCIPGPLDSWMDVLYQLFKELAV